MLHDALPIFGNNDSAELISKFITQQHAVAMADKSREYEKKIQKLEKGGKDKGSG